MKDLFKNYFSHTNFWGGPPEYSFSANVPWLLPARHGVESSHRQLLSAVLGASLGLQAQSSGSASLGTQGMDQLTEA